MARTAAVMKQTGDGPDLQLSQLTEALVCSRPIAGAILLGSGAFPKHRVAQSLQAKAREVLQITVATPMAIKFKLVVELVPDAVDRAFDSAPELQGFSHEL